MASGDQPTEAPSAPAVRASDADRERTATLLREHYGAGRITPEELSERLDAALAARTLAELGVLADDLPALGEPGAAAPRLSSTARDQARRRVVHAAGLAALVNAACIAVWLASGGDGSFWPQWVLLATAIRLAFRAWSELGPGAAHDEARLGRGGSAPRPQPPLPPPERR